MRFSCSQSSKRSGFTLIELMVTMVILGIAATLITNFFIEQSRLGVRICDFGELNNKMRLLTARFESDAQKAQATLVYENFDPNTDATNKSISAWYSSAEKNASGGVKAVPVDDKRLNRRGNAIVFVQKECIPALNATELPKTKYRLVLYFLKYEAKPKITKKKLYRWSIGTKGDPKEPSFDWDFLLEYLLSAKSDLHPIIDNSPFVENNLVPDTELMTVECHADDLLGNALPPFYYVSPTQAYVQMKLFQDRNHRSDEACYQYEIIPTGTDARPPTQAELDALLPAASGAAPQ